MRSARGNNNRYTPYGGQQQNNPGMNQQMFQQMMTMMQQQMGMPQQSYQQPQQQSQQQDLYTIKVGNESEPQTVAGAIAHACRNGECPSITVIGARAINQAIKAVAIARNYLVEDRIDLAAEPWFKEEDKDFVQFSMRKVSALRNTLAETASLKVASSSVPSKVAGSIANSIRQGERISVTAMGAGSVNQAVGAIILARRYLKGDGMGLHFRPSFFVAPASDGSERSMVKFMLYASQV